MRSWFGDCPLKQGNKKKVMGKILKERAPGFMVWILGFSSCSSLLSCPELSDRKIYEPCIEPASEPNFEIGVECLGFGVSGVGLRTGRWEGLRRIERG